MAEGAPLLQARGLYKSYRRAREPIDVLANLECKLYAGDSVSIVGASGAGKSTLLHVLGTLDRPDSGELLFLGEPLAGQSSAALAAFRNRSLGFVFQFHHLLPDFDALENAMLPALIARRPEAEARALATEALSLVGLSHRLRHRPQQLSGGEQQRVALARAIVLRPPLLLLDEVTGNLDADTAAGIHDLLLELNRALHTTLVVVTHNLPLAQRMATRWQLRAGQLVPADAPLSPGPDAAASPLALAAPAIASTLAK